MAIGVQVTFDCADPEALSRFWATALEYVLPDPPDGYPSWPEWALAQGIPEDQWDVLRSADDPAGKGPRLLFQRVPEPKVTKNRVHLDLNVGAGLSGDARRATVDAEVLRLADLGASVVEPMDIGREYWVVMRDPEGNEFCVQ